MGIGPYKDTEGTTHGVNFKTTPVKFLGIYVGNDPEKCKEKNWDEKSKKIKTTLLLWKRRDLTIFGKNSIIKWLVLPIITFTSQSTCVPPDAVKHINRIFFDFIKVKVQAYSLISSLKTYHPTLHLTLWSLDLFIRVPFQLHEEHTVLQPFRRIELIVHIAISVLPGTHFHLSQVKHLRVKCLAQGHNILTMSQDWEGRNMIFLWKSCTKRDSKQYSRERHRQSATL